MKVSTKESRKGKKEKKLKKKQFYREDMCSFERIRIHSTNHRNLIPENRSLCSDLVFFMAVFSCPIKRKLKHLRMFNTYQFSSTDLVC